MPFPLVSRGAMPALLALVLAAAPAHAQWSGPLHDAWWVLPGGGARISAGGAYALGGAIGQDAVATLTGGPFTLRGGFWTLPSAGGPTDAPPNALPTEFALLPLAPNPFTTASVVTFALPRAAHVRAEVFDLSGHRVKGLLDATRPAGEHRLAWQGDDDAGRPAPAGVYFVRVRAGDNESTRRVVHVN